MTPIEVFHEHHAPQCPRPIPAGPVNVFGGITCGTCQFEVVVANHLAGCVSEESRYREFLRSKLPTHQDSGFEVSALPDWLYDFQQAVVDWALRKGRAAIFADTGLGKTAMQLAWAYHVSAYTGKRVLILAPLAVGQQTVREARKFGLDAEYCRSQAAADLERHLVVANYEMLEHFDPAAFVGVVLDESSVLKNYTGKTKRALIEAFADTPYKLCCTATPSPNDTMELGNHADFLNVMASNEMLARWFINDTMHAGNYRLKRHAESDFWRWVSSWAVTLRMPSDVGPFNDAPFRLPKLEIQTHSLVNPKVALSRGKLFLAGEAPSATNLWKDKAESAERRCQEVARLVLAEPKQDWIVWCETNKESELLARRIPSAVEVRGSDSIAKKEAAIASFLSGEVPILITKSSICGFGLNLQHVSRMAFAGLTYSFESLHQAIRRIWRFGQQQDCQVHIVTSETEVGVLETINRKRREHETMQQRMVDATREHFLDQDRSLKTVNHEIRRGGGWELHIGDCVDVLATLPESSIGLTVTSIPFSNIYIYSDSLQDMGNSADHREFFRHFDFVARALLRVTIPGRLCAVHCKDLPLYMNRDGAAGLYDFPGDIIRSFESAGWRFHSRVTIWKDPVTEMQRTKNHGLLHKNFIARREVCRQGMADYVVVFRAWKGDIEDGQITGMAADYVGENPPTDYEDARDYSIQVWQRYASPVWFDINQMNVLQYRDARSAEDERHICPLQLDVIERCVVLWSNPGDLVLDPFAGIGSVPFVAMKTKRRTIGIELKPEYAEIAELNLKAAEKTQGTFGFAATP